MAGDSLCGPRGEQPCCFRQTLKHGPVALQSGPASSSPAPPHADLGLCLLPPGLAVHQIITITVSLIMVIAALITTLVLKNW